MQLRTPLAVDVAAKLITKVKQSGSFGYASALPESAAAQNPTVKITRVRAQPVPSKVREFADDVRDGRFVLPIGRRMPLRDAAEAHVLGEKAALGTSSCWRPIHNTDSFTANSVELRSAHIIVLQGSILRPGLHSFHFTRVNRLFGS
jgi:hypothetical protein